MRFFGQFCRVVWQQIAFLSWAITVDGVQYEPDIPAARVNHWRTGRDGRAVARRSGNQARQGQSSEPTGWPRPNMAASSRRSRTAPTRITASTSPSCRAGPNVNNRILLISGKLDFFMSANTLQSFDAVANNVPVVAVAAIFQKDPQVFLAHPNPKVTKLEDLKPLTLLDLEGGRRRLFPMDAIRAMASARPRSSLTPSMRSLSSSTRTARCRAMSRPSRSWSRSRPISSQP